MDRRAKVAAIVACVVLGVLCVTMALLRLESDAEPHSSLTERESTGTSRPL